MKLKNLLREIIENPMITKLEQSLKSHDWYSEYSDDHRSWLRGSADWERIRQLIAQINNAGLEKEATAVWKKTVPTDLKTRYPKNLSK